MQSLRARFVVQSIEVLSTPKQPIRSPALHGMQHVQHAVMLTLHASSAG